MIRAIAGLTPCMMRLWANSRQPRGQMRERNKWEMNEMRSDGRMCHSR